MGIKLIADIEPSTMNISVESVKRLISKKTKRNLYALWRSTMYLDELKSYLINTKFH